MKLENNLCTNVQKRNQIVCSALDAEKKKKEQKKKEDEKKEEKKKSGMDAYAEVYGK